MAGEGIQVNAANPGLIKIEIYAAGGAPDCVGRLAAMITIGRGGEAEERPPPRPTSPVPGSCPFPRLKAGSLQKKMIDILD